MTDPREAAEARAREFLQQVFSRVLSMDCIAENVPRLADSYLTLGEEQRKASEDDARAEHGTGLHWKRRTLAVEARLDEALSKVARLTEELAAARAEVARQNTVTADSVREVVLLLNGRVEAARKEAEEAKAKGRFEADSLRAKLSIARAERQTLEAVVRGEQGIQYEDEQGNVTYEVNVADLRSRLSEAEASLQAAQEEVRQWKAESRRGTVSLEVAQDEIRRKDDALRLIESVYRQNAVVPGEPSSVLDAVCAALAPSKTPAVPEAAAVPAPGTPLKRSDIEETLHSLLVWAEDRKDHETLHRPDVNIFKPVLVATWDQVLLEIRTRLSGVRGIEEVPLPAPHSTRVPAEEPKR